MARRHVTSQQGAAASQELTTEEELQVREYKARDAEVRAHEQAHVSAGGQYVSGGASYSYENGPDGKRYAVGGEVNIDVSAVSGDPRATMTKAQAVRRAALAPADPSGQDRSVAAKATAMERTARSKLAEEVREPAEGSAEAAGAVGEASGPAEAAGAAQSEAAAPGPAAVTWAQPAANRQWSTAPSAAPSAPAGVQRLDIHA